MEAQPVTLFGKVGDFPSIKAAAKHLGVGLNAVQHAIAQGTNCKGHFVLLADMPVDCQPLARRRKRKRPRCIPVVWKGKRYPSISAAAKGDRGVWMKIWRAQREARKQ
jgi:hypothetical protein